VKRGGRGGKNRLPSHSSERKKGGGGKKGGKFIPLFLYGKKKEKKEESLRGEKEKEEAKSNPQFFNAEPRERGRGGYFDALNLTKGKRGKKRKKKPQGFYRERREKQTIKA